jgi:hypothetical protein
LFSNKDQFATLFLQQQLTTYLDQAKDRDNCLHCGKEICVRSPNFGGYLAFKAGLVKK